MDGFTNDHDGNTHYSAVLKMQQHARHIIQKHLHSLAGDFGRFQERMDNLAKHIAQAHADVDLVYTSAKKITQRFDQIEKVELEGITSEAEDLSLPENS